ncbi:MAG TPA: hypothetical protein VFF06_03505 [Polyangia bacterium]|nr:hypothetical protein [Polyangia bacterium]
MRASRRAAALAAALALAVTLALAGCEKNNGAYCDATIACPNGGTCDLVARQCSTSASDLPVVLPDLAGVDLAGVDLTSTCTACPPEKPLCVSGACAPCNAATNADDACKALDQTRAHCLSTGPDAGRCVNCTTNGDCTQPHDLICDPTAHACRGCVANGECDSLICDTVFDPVFGASIQRGDCLPPGGNNIIYVDQLNCPSTVDGSKAKPYCHLATAISKVTSTLNIIHAAPSSYAEDLQVGNDTSFILVGDPGSPDTALVGKNNEPIHINGNGGTNVTLIGLDFPNSPSGHSSIWCDSGKVAVYQTRVANSGYYGIDGSPNCSNVVVDQCRIGPGNSQGGLHVGVSGSNTSFTITNNFVFRNGSASSLIGGVSLFSSTSVSPRVFVNNTIANNTTQTGYAGVACALGAPFTINQNILFSNIASATISESNCTTRYTATDDHFDAISFQSNNVDLSVTGPAFLDNANNDYHLQSGSPCKGTAGASALTNHDIDGDPRPSVGTSRFDIGADQLP